MSLWRNLCRVLYLFIWFTRRTNKKLKVDKLNFDNFRFDRLGFTIRWNENTRNLINRVWVWVFKKLWIICVKIFIQTLFYMSTIYNKWGQKCSLFRISNTRLLVILFMQFSSRIYNLCKGYVRSTLWSTFWNTRWYDLICVQRKQRRGNWTSSPNS